MQRGIRAVTASDTADDGVVALVLAGSRGPDDPVARAAGVGHKAFAPVAGRAMVLRVLDAVRQVPSIQRIAVVIEADADLSAVPTLASEMEHGRILRLNAAHSPAASVAAALERLGGESPLLVTTADHPLLTGEMVERFLAAASKDAAVSVAVTPAEVVRRDYPGSVRTFYRFGREAVSGCNLFLLRGDDARNAVAFWQRIERERKRPWRMVAALGPLTLAAFVLGRLSLEGALARLSRRIGVSLAAVRLPVAEAAIDVDRPEDLLLAEEILTRREGQSRAPHSGG